VGSSHPLMNCLWEVSHVPSPAPDGAPSPEGEGTAGLRGALAKPGRKLPDEESIKASIRARNIRGELS
jgi:hypothetical protein